MAATVLIRRLTGATPTATDITSGTTRASTSDSPTPTTTNPIPVPGAGASNYSFWVTTQLAATVAPTNSCSNVRWYSDGTNTFGTGVNAIVGVASAYVVANGTTGSSGSLLNITNHTGLITGGTSPFTTYTSGGKLTIAGSIAATTGSFGNRLVYQLSVESTAGAGNTGEETFSWQFDET